MGLMPEGQCVCSCVEGAYYRGRIICCDTSPPWGFCADSTLSTILAHTIPGSKSGRFAPIFDNHLVISPRGTSVRQVLSKTKKQKNLATSIPHETKKETSIQRPPITFSARWRTYAKLDTIRRGSRAQKVRCLRPRSGFVFRSRERTEQQGAENVIAVLPL